MEPNSLEAFYSSKSDDELLSLATDSGSLTDEAREVLARELAKRHLRATYITLSPAPNAAGKHAFPHIRSDAINRDENPAFNLPAKIAWLVLFVFTWGTAIGVLAPIVRYDNEWKREIASIAVGIVLVFGPIFAAIAWATRRHFRNKTIRKPVRNLPAH